MHRSAAVFLLLLVLVAPRLLHTTDEVSRLQDHFRSVEAELLARDVSHLTPGQRSARARNIRVLREYAARGVFPHNHDFSGEHRPYFVDPHGTLCAMAYLIARSGHGALVERVAATRNHAYLPELADDPELSAWLEASGLSLEEAARIQPTYGHVPGEGVDVSTARDGAIMLGVEGATVAWNLLGSPERGAGWLSGTVGIAAGGVGAFVFGGIGSTSMDGGERELHGLHRTAGAASVLAGAWGFGRWLYGRAASPSAREEAAGEASLSVTPWVGRRGEPGIRAPEPAPHARACRATHPSCRS